MALKLLADIGTELLEKAMKDKPLFHFGLQAFDGLLDGMHADRINVISGDPGAGKSTFVGLLADDAASNGTFVFVHSYELADRCYLSKSLARSGKVTVKDISCDDKAELVEKVGKEYLERTARNLAFLDEDDTVKDLERYVKAKHKQAPEQPILVVCDYIQNATIDRLKEVKDERLQLKEILGTLRKIAKIENVAVFAVSAITRSSYQKAAPSLNALSGSSSLEYGCDTCIHLSTDADDNSLMKPVELTFLKNRFGAKGTAEFIFDVEHANFIEA